MSLYRNNTANQFIGYFTDLPELQGQRPVGVDGEYVIILSLDKKYYWDISSRSWTDGGSIDATEGSQDDIISKLSDIKTNQTNKSQLTKIVDADGNVVRFVSPEDLEIVLREIRNGVLEPVWYNQVTNTLAIAGAVTVTGTLTTVSTVTGVTTVSTVSNQTNIGGSSADSIVENSMDVDWGVTTRSLYI